MKKESCRGTKLKAHTIWHSSSSILWEGAMLYLRTVLLKAHHDQVMMNMVRLIGRHIDGALPHSSRNSTQRASLRFTPAAVS